MSRATVLPHLKRARSLATVAGLTLLALPAMSLSSTASAALPTECHQPGLPGDDHVVCTYSTAGEHPFVVPTGVTTLTVDLIGGKGGDGADATAPGTGGQGAEVKGDITVTAGATIFAEVGGNGTASGKGGFNGGGNTGTTTATGTTLAGGGGGASDIRTNSTDLTTRLVVAGGGGGAGAKVNGGAAGADGTGAAGIGDVTTNGKAASGTTGGAAGTVGAGPVPGAVATSGAAGLGGNGRATLAADGYVGGGGGGGLAGGGGGDADAVAGGAGGGGGSSKVPATNPTGPTLTGSAPMVKITYAPGPATALTFTLTSPVAINTADPLVVTETDVNGAIVKPGALVFTFDPAGAGSCDATACTFIQLGDVKITGTDGALNADLTVTVIHGPPVTLTIDPVSDTIQPNGDVTYTTHGVDAAGDPFDATSESTFAIAPSSGGSATGASCTLNVCTAAALGTYSVTATDGTATAIATLTVEAAATTTPTPTPTPTPSGSTTTPGGSNNNSGKGPLANTGTAVENGVRYALALLALGAAVVAFARRRQLRVAHAQVRRPHDSPSIGFRLPPHTH